MNGGMSKRETTTVGNPAGNTRNRRRHQVTAGGNPASAALDEINAALRGIPEVGSVIREIDPATLHIDTINADPMNEGHGSRAMTIMCEVCDRHGVKLTGYIVHDENEGYGDDPFADDEDGFEGDEDAPLSPSSDDLERWYAEFGFTVVREDWKSAIRRPPLAFGLDASADTEPEPGPARGPRF